MDALDTAVFCCNENMTLIGSNRDCKDDIFLDFVKDFT